MEIEHLENNKYVVECEDLCIGYGKQKVMENINLKIKKGDFVAFIGPNGAGKTTLIRTILGLIKPISGKIIKIFSKYGGSPGYVPQYKVIDPIFPINVEQLICMGLFNKLGFWRKVKGEEKEKLIQVLKDYGLFEHRYKLFSELSGGMKQKVILARAFITDAETFVVDEPTSELDENSEKEVLEKLQRYSTDEGKTVLMIGHSQIAGFLEKNSFIKRLNLTYGKIALESGERND